VASTDILRSPAVGSAGVPALPARSFGQAHLLAVAVWIVVGLLLLVAPSLLAPFQLSLLVDVLILGVIALSVDLLVGITGLPSLGQAAYYGIGGYASALLAMHVTSSSPAHVVLAFFAGCLAAALTGWIAVRTRGVYFLMLTLAVGQVFFSLAVSWKSVTGGSDGLASLPAPTLWGEGSHTLGLGAELYWYVLAFAALTLVMTVLLTRTRFGGALRGIRQNEPRMRALGYPTSHYKFMVFVVAGGIAGLAGALQVANRSYFSPDELTYHVSTLALFAALIGGRGTLVGAFGGAAVIVVVRDYVVAYIDGHGPLLLGILFVAVVYLLPNGIAGSMRSMRRRYQRLTAHRRPKGAPTRGA
jgi:branched-chain amino acid transport system permease protein